MSKKLYNRLLLYAGYFILILSLITVYANLDETQLTVFLNSDTIGVHLLIEDVFFKNTDSSGWVLASAPTFFPDLFLYYILRVLFGSSPTLTPFLYSLVQVFIICALLVYIFRKITPENFRRFDFLIPVLFSLIFIESYFFSHDVSFAFFLCVPSYHCGAFLNALLGLSIYLSNVKSSVKYIFLFALSIIAGFSDLLFIAMFTAPFCLSILIKLRRVNLRRHLLTIILVSAGTMIGVKIYYYIRDEKIFQFTDPHKIYAFKDIVPSFNLFKTQIFDYLTIPGGRSFLILFTLFGSIIFFIISLKNRLKNDTESFVLLFFVMFTGAVLAAPILNGNYSGYDTLRYNVHPFYFSVLVLGFLVSKLLQRFEKASVFISVIVLIIFFILPILKFEKTEFDRYFSYYPKLAREIDSLKPIYKLNKGVADYWLAKKTTALSHANVQILTAYPEGNMAELGSNKNWYYEGSFNFIVSNGYPKEVVEKYFKIKDTIKITDYDVLLVEDFYYKKGEYFPSPLKK